VNWRTLFLVWMFSSTASRALLWVLFEHEVIAVSVNAAKAMDKILFFIMSRQLDEIRLLITMILGLNVTQC
jgi:hypothetical protein